MTREAPAEAHAGSPVEVTLLGKFCISSRGREAGPWSRPSAKRLCELVLLSPGQTVSRDRACSELFDNLGTARAARALSKSLSMARGALACLGEPGASLLQSDLANIWASAEALICTDLVLHEKDLRAGLALSAGDDRDDRLTAALSQDGVLLADEPYAEWAHTARDRLERLRQEARLAVARDRAKGWGRAGEPDVVQAWEACLTADAACEEAAIALVEAYSAQGRRALAVTVLDQCRRALDDLGLVPSSELRRAEEALARCAEATRDSTRASSLQTWYRTEGRRPITVLSVELSLPGAGAGVDPEEWRDLVDAALAAVVGEVESLGGTATSISAAGVLAIFGAPEAHEDDPERALLAAFRALSHRAQADGALLSSAGVETGLAVTGEMGGGLKHTYGAVGEVVTVSAALRAASLPGSVLVGPATRAATEGLFDWGSTKVVAMAGGGKQIRASYLVGPRKRPAFEPARRRPQGRPAIVGRDPELDVLRGAVRDVTTRQGGVVVMRGEPGIGKTRLVEECRHLFMGWVRAAPGRLPLWLEGRAASYASAQPYALYRHLLTQWVGAGADESDDLAWAALERALRATFGAGLDPELLALLGHVMGLRASLRRPAAAAVGPEALQQASFSACTALFSRLAGYGPVVLALEDLHWADPTSLRLTETVATLTKNEPLLLLLTLRPELSPAPALLDAFLSTSPGLRVHRTDVGPLGDAAEEELAKALLAARAPDEVVREIRRGTEGNPFFLEERISSLVETDALQKDADGTWHLGAAGRDELPQAIERLVRARVDRLAPGPYHAIIAASVLGPEFSLTSLETVTAPGTDLREATDELCSAGLFVDLKQVPEPTYRFRHALVQEATYRGLLKHQRQHLHARAATGLEGASAGKAEEIASILGDHYAKAGRSEKAAHYLELAADRAASAFANDEAVASYEYALRQLVAGGDQQAEKQGQIWFKMGQLFLHLRRYDEGRHAFQEAARHFPPTAAIPAADALRLLSWVEVADRRRPAALEALGTADRLLNASPDRASDQWARAWIDLQLMRGFYHFYGDPVTLGDVLARARSLVEAKGGPKQRADFYTQVGYQRAAERRFVIDDDVLDCFKQAWSIVVEAGLEGGMDTHFVHAGVAYFLLIRGDLAGAAPLLEAGLDKARRANDKSWLFTGFPVLAWLRLRQGDVSGARDLAEQGAIPDMLVPFPFPEMAKAVLAWVAWKEGRNQDVERLAGEVLRPAYGSEPPFPFGCICLWPLIGVRLAEGRPDQAMEAAGALLAPPQMRLPPELEAEVQAALDAWGRGAAGLARNKLAGALALAEQLKFA